MTQQCEALAPLNLKPKALNPQPKHRNIKPACCQEAAAMNLMTKAQPASPPPRVCPESAIVAADHARELQCTTSGWLYTYTEGYIPQPIVQRRQSSASSHWRSVSCQPRGYPSISPPRIESPRKSCCQKLQRLSPLKPNPL